MLLINNFQRGRLLTLCKHYLFLLIGIFISTFGTWLIYQSNLGLGPFDVLHQGISLHTPLTFGEATIVINILVLLLSLLLKMRPGIGTILDLLLQGIFFDFFQRYLPILVPHTLFLQLPLLLIGTLLVGYGTTATIIAGLGPGPKDGLMVCLACITQIRTFIVRAALEGCALLVGYFLGGSIGIGTLLYACTLGVCIEGSFWLIKTYHK